MRNMSFMLTTDQIRNRTKTVTRRLGWEFLKPGDLVRAVEKCQGLKKGEKMQTLAVLRVEDVRREPLDRIRSEPQYGFEEVKREGFDTKAMWPSDFIAMFVRSHRPCLPHWLVTRIEFSYVDQVGCATVTAGEASAPLQSEAKESSSLTSNRGRE